MSLYFFLIIFISVFLNAIAQLLLKNGTTFIKGIEFSDNFSLIVNGFLKNYYFLGGFFSYAISIFIWIYALSKVQVSVAYPMLSLGFVINAIGAWYFLGESLNFLKIIGISLILVGVFTLFKSS